MAGNASQIHIDSSAVKTSAKSIQASIAEIKQLSQKIGKSLDANRDAYGQGDVDAASMNSSVQEITSVLNENSEQLEQDIDALVRFADAMESLFQ